MVSSKFALLAHSSAMMGATSCASLAVGSCVTASGYGSISIGFWSKLSMSIHYIVGNIYYILDIVLQKLIWVSQL